MRDEFVWVEKYRPKTIEECILPDNIKKTFQDFLDKGEVPNLLLSGPPGCGKTTVAKALCQELGADYYVINGSDEDDSLIPSEIMRRTLLRPYRFRLLQDTKSSSLMRQITQPQMYNSPYGRLLRSLLVTADSSSPATTKTKSFNRFIVGVPSSSSPLREKKDRELQPTSSKEFKKYSIWRRLSMKIKSLLS